MESYQLIGKDDHDLFILFASVLKETEPITIRNSDGVEYGTIPEGIKLFFPSLPIVDRSLLIDDPDELTLFYKLVSGLLNGELEIPTQLVTQFLHTVCKMAPSQTVGLFITDKIKKHARWELLGEMIAHYLVNELYEKIVISVAESCQIKDIWKRDVPDIFLNTAKGRSILCKKLRSIKVDEEIGPFDELEKLTWIVAQIDRMIIGKPVSLKGVYDLLATIEWFHVPRRDGRIQLAIIKGLYSEFVESGATEKMKLRDSLPKVIPEKSLVKIEVAERKENTFLISAHPNPKPHSWVTYTTTATPKAIELKISHVSTMIDGALHRAIKIEPSKLRVGLMDNSTITVSVYARTEINGWSKIHKDRTFEFRKGEKGTVKPLYIDTTRTKGKVLEYKIVLKEFFWVDKQILTKEKDPKYYKLAHKGGHYRHKKETKEINELQALSI